MRSLAVKYRPKTWDDVTEQAAIIDILRNQVETDTQKHSYLFVGPAGCGKTTCARIFASSLDGAVHEIDAASNSGVENVRGIVADAQKAPLHGRYRVYIVDECFHANTLVDTPQGKKRICSIRPGDEVFNLAGRGTVTQVHENSVLTSRLCCVTINGEKLITTADHLFFTDDGWVPAKNLQKGQELYGTKTVSAVWEKIYKQTQNGKILQSSLCCAIQERTQTPYSDEGAEVRNLRYGISDSEMFDKAMLLEAVCAQAGSEEGVRQNLFRIEKAAVVRKQPNAQSGNCAENACHPESEWNPRYGFCGTWREWEIHQTATAAARQSSGVGAGICDTDGLYAEDGILPYQLQSRPSLSFFAAGDRGGWQNPFEEIATAVGRKENNIAANFRVDSVEIYKRGDNERLFSDCFSSEQLQEETVSMYDLEVDNHPSYYANDVLVHNCHSLSNGAWQAFLKLLEEPPKTSVFIFCTTDPQKIPATIISRVQRYDFSKMSLNGIINRLEYILEQEQQTEEVQYSLSVTAEAMEYIAKLAEGGMRDAITNLDQCLSLEPNVTLSTVTSALGVSNYDTFQMMLLAMLDKAHGEAVEIISSVYNDGKDLKQFMRQFQFYLLDVMKYLTFGNFKLVQIPELPKYRTAMDEMDRYEVLDLLSWARDLNNILKWDGNPRAVTETAILLKAAFVPEE